MVPPAGNDVNYFSCDIPKGAVNSGQETVVEIKFTPPEIPAQSNLECLRGIGQWVEQTWECKITGGFLQPGETDLKVYDVVLRAYVEQI